MPPTPPSASTGSSPEDDLLNNGGLGVGVVLDVRPPSGGKLTLGALIELTLFGAVAQHIADEQHPLRFCGPTLKTCTCTSGSKSGRNRCSYHSGSRDWSWYPAASRS